MNTRELTQFLFNVKPWRFGFSKEKSANDIASALFLCVCSKKKKKNSTMTK